MGGEYIADGLGYISVFAKGEDGNWRWGRHGTMGEGWIGYCATPSSRVTRSQRREGWNSA